MEELDFLLNLFSLIDEFAKIAIEFCQGEKINSLSRIKLFGLTNSIRQIILSNWLKTMGVKRVTALQIEEITQKKCYKNKSFDL